MRISTLLTRRGRGAKSNAVPKHVGYPTVAKAELGTKRICPETGRKFYDLGKNPVVSPYTGHVVPIEAPSSRSKPEPAAAAKVAPEEVEVPETQDAEIVSLEEA